MMAEKNVAEGCLKLWEGFVFSDPKKVSSLNHGSYSNGESGPLRLIRSVFKLHMPQLSHFEREAPVLRGVAPFFLKSPVLKRSDDPDLNVRLRYL